MDRDQPLFTSLSYRRRNKRIGDTNARRLSKLDHLRGEDGLGRGKGEEKGRKKQRYQNGRWRRETSET